MGGAPFHLLHTPSVWNSQTEPSTCSQLADSLCCSVVHSCEPEIFLNLIGGNWPVFQSQFSFLFSSVRQTKII